MRFEQTSGRLVARRQISPSLVFTIVVFALLIFASIVKRFFVPNPDALWTQLFVVSLGILIFLVSWRSYLIEADGATRTIRVVHRRIGRTDERTVSFDDVTKIMWLRVGVPWKKLHRVDLYLEADSVMLIDEQYRSFDQFSTAEVERFVRGIAKVVHVPMEERDL